MFAKKPAGFSLHLVEFPNLEDRSLPAADVEQRALYDEFPVEQLLQLRFLAGIIDEADVSAAIVEQGTLFDVRGHKEIYYTMKWFILSHQRALDYKPCFNFGILQRNIIWKQLP